ncbi:MAG TPA: thioesterase family protein [Byssovorax sp.]|jgi:YbgC/YbaW family acyl-CoA thioester hydrolase
MTPTAFSRAELLDARVALYGERRVVRFQDVDAAGIVFYPRILEMFSDAYVATFAARGFDLPRALRKDPVVLPLAHAEADFLAPLRFGDVVDVEVVAARVGEASFRVGYRATKDHQRAAFGQTIHVCIDRTTSSSMRVPDAIRRVLGA